MRAVENSVPGFIDWRSWQLRRRRPTGASPRPARDTGSEPIACPVCCLAIQGRLPVQAGELCPVV